MSVRTGEEAGDASQTCWCCGQRVAESSVVRLGNRPDVAVCLRCAHVLHRQARAVEDAGRPSPPARARDVLRAAREQVVRRGWHQRPLVGGLLRRLGRWTP